MFRILSNFLQHQELLLGMLTLQKLFPFRVIFSPSIHTKVDTWRAVKIWTENLTDVRNGFLPLIHVPPMIQNKTEVLNLKTRKTQVSMGYLALKRNITSTNE